jgi:SAM-dependent methyltransferase
MAMGSWRGALAGRWWKRWWGGSATTVRPESSAAVAAAAERVVERVRRDGAAWISEETPVATALAIEPAARHGDGAVMLAPAAPVAAREWRYVALGLAAPSPASVARLSWDASADVAWKVAGGATTWVLDLQGTAWGQARDVTRLGLATDAPGGVRVAWAALLGDLGQLAGGDMRWDLAARHLRGLGVECGALQHPLALPPGARAFYVDRLTPAGARADYPELDGHPLTEPNVVGDLQRLPLRDGSVDFHVGNHLLEHARDPIGGLEEMLRIVRPGGVLYVSVPDVGNPLDRLRPVTPFDHLLADHEAGRDRSAEDAAHYREAFESAHATMPTAQREELIARMRAQSYSIHFHTFDEPSFRELLRFVASRRGARVVEFARNPGPDFDEYIACLRRVA